MLIAENKARGRSPRSVKERKPIYGIDAARFGRCQDKGGEKTTESFTAGGAPHSAVGNPALM